MSFLKLPRHAGTTKAKSDRQERRLAKELGGRPTPGSGSGGIKGDITTPDEMIEAKTTSKTQFTLKLVDLKKLEYEARAVGKRPVLVIHISDDSPTFLQHPEWVVIPKNDYIALKENHDH